MQGPAAVPPVKDGAAFGVSGFWQRVEPLEVIDHRYDALGELTYRIERKVIELRCQRQPGNSAPYRGNGHPVEDIVERLEFEAPAGSLGDNTDSDAAKNRLRIVDEAQEAARTI